MQLGAQVPSKRRVAKFVREHLCDRPIESLLRGAVSRCLIDDDRNVYVEIPWREAGDKVLIESILPEKESEPAGRSGFAQVPSGAPNGIRTRDLRLERATS